jgi:hypothetical protein
MLLVLHLCSICSSLFLIARSWYVFSCEVIFCDALLFDVRHMRAPFVLFQLCVPACLASCLGVGVTVVFIRIMSAATVNVIASMPVTTGVENSVTATAVLHLSHTD